jgi:hypothetical protein
MKSNESSIDWAKLTRASFIPYIQIRGKRRKKGNSIQGV